MEECSSVVFFFESAVIICFIFLAVVFGILVCSGKIVVYCPKQNRKNYEDLDNDVENNTTPNRIDITGSADIGLHKRNQQVDSQVHLRRLQEDLGRQGQHLAIERERNQDLQKKLAQETKEKDDALRRLSAIMSSRLRDGNPNVTDLSDQNRPVKIVEQFSELYDNQWTDAFSALQTSLPQDKTEPEITGVLLFILEQCYVVCNEKASRQTAAFNAQVSIIAEAVSNKASKLPSDLMQRIREERKMYAADGIPDCNEVLPQLKEHFWTSHMVADFINSQSVTLYVQECLKLCWLMMIQDPPMQMVLQPHGNADGLFRAYKHNGKRVEFVVWPALLVEDGGALLMKGVAEFGD